jgi:hypothetical protein
MKILKMMKEKYDVGNDENDGNLKWWKKVNLMEMMKENENEKKMLKYDAWNDENDEGYQMKWWKAWWKKLKYDAMMSDMCKSMMDNQKWWKWWKNEGRKNGHE